MAASSAGFVAGLAAAALATVGFLAFQASATVPADLSRPRVDSARGVSISKAPRDKRSPTALPAGSGAGQRVVYSIDDDRVWLVDRAGKVKRTFRVTPGSVDPLPGVYAVTSRSKAVTGTDGIPIEHVVRFATVDDVTIGFSAAVEGATPLPNPHPSQQTGGIRERQRDGDAMWAFATIGRPVVVIH
ncbi:hypothetical protein [Streptomyces sp. NPDC093568]|uniref:hypothetical protein n=1 Tax=Streptomyces sp. NPDC093568 TaxID=3366041 RepID=UPI003824A8AC